MNTFTSPLVALTALAIDSIILFNTHLVDVEAGRVREERALRVEGGVIVALGDEALRGEGMRIDGEGGYVIPALVDAHVHFADPDRFGPLLLAHGVTLARDLGGDTDTVLQLREDLRDGSRTGPLLVVTGAILDGDPPIWPTSEICRDAEEGRANVAKLVAAGVDQIKVYSRLPREAYFAILAACEAEGVAAVGHVPSAVRLEEAVGAGQRSIEHMTGFGDWISRLAGKGPLEGFFAEVAVWPLLAEVPDPLTEPLLREMVAAGTVVCPTLAVYEGMFRTAAEAAADPRLELVAPFLREFWGQRALREVAQRDAILAAQRQMVARLYHAGVPLVCGTDLANPNVFAGDSLHDEMASFQRAGLPAAEVLRAATSRSCELLGLGSRRGTVAVGKDASLLLLRANPLEDIRNARQIELLLDRGRVYRRTDLDALIDSVRQDLLAMAEPGDGGPDGEFADDEDDAGALLQRGTYELSFGSFPAGRETFVLRATADRLTLRAKRRPSGGPEAPSDLTLVYTPEHAFEEARWHSRGATDVVATYVREGDQVVARAVVDGDEQEPQRIDFPPGSALSTPCTGSDYFLHEGLALAVGETTEKTVVAFGYPDWHLVSYSITCARLPDEDFPLGAEVFRVEVYAYEFSTPMGTLRVTNHRARDGRILRSTLVLPFGTARAQLAAP